MKARNSSAAILWRNLIFLITVTTFFLGLLTMVGVTYQLFKNEQATSQTVIKRLKTTIIDDNYDWREWKANNPLDVQKYHLHVINMRADAKVKNYYSPGTKKLNRQLQPVHLVSGLYRRGDDFHLRATGHAKGIRYILWVDLHDNTHFIKQILWIILMAWIIILLFSPLYVTLLTDWLISSLLSLNESVKNLHGDKHHLPVPNRPTEVQSLAQNFNQLLDELDEQNAKERIFVNNAAH